MVYNKLSERTEKNSKEEKSKLMLHKLNPEVQVDVEEDMEEAEVEAEVDLHHTVVEEVEEEEEEVVQVDIETAIKCEVFAYYPYCYTLFCT
jgi:hypothetical protein